MPLRLNRHGMQVLMRDIYQTIREMIAEEFNNRGFRGDRMDGGGIIGQLPMGVARIIVQKDGIQVGEPTYILNFIGDGFLVTWNAEENRIDINNPLATPPYRVIDYSFNNVTNVAGDQVIVA